MSETDNAEELTFCPICRKPIPNDARKCTECDSYLDWRRFLGVGQTSLALLIALISVISTTAPSFYEWLSADYSKLHAETRQVYREKLELFVSNQGNQIGRLVSVSLGATTQSGKMLNPITLEVAHDGQILPKAATVVHLTVHPENVSQFLSWPFSDIKKCSLTVRLAEYRELPESNEIDCPLDSLMLFCKGTEGAAKQFGRVDLRTSHCTGLP
jgi:predicted nucleic acid-binding Zn ribbon protein